MLTGKSAQEWIDAYLDRRPAELAEIGEKLRRLMKKTVAGTKESVNPWKIPTFESNGPMCYMSIGKNHLTFGFLRGNRAARSSRTPGRNRQESAAREGADGGRSEESCVEEIDLSGGEIE